MQVLYISEKEGRREWEVKKNELNFPYEILYKVPADQVRMLSLFRKVSTRLNALGPAVLIIDGYSYASCWAGLVWAKTNNKKIILWSSSNEDDHRRVFYKELIKRFIIKNCNAFNVYGTKSREYLIKLGAQKDNIFIVGNNTDNAFYYNETMKWKKERLSLCQGFGIPEKNFLYIGRFSSEKNIFTLLDAYGRTTGWDSGWGLILIGSGPQKQEIESYIENSGIKNVFMPGFKQKDEIPKFLAVSDVFILPSISETWGLVVNEAMAAGLPVIVSKKCGCYPDLVRDGENGFSFNPLDKDGLFNIMKEIVDGKMDLKRMGESSLEIVKGYTPERAAKIIVETIELVTQEKIKSY